MSVHHHSQRGGGGLSGGGGRSSVFGSLGASWMACTLAELTTHPLDMLKTRLQFQKDIRKIGKLSSSTPLPSLQTPLQMPSQKLAPAPATRNLVQTFVGILKEEGVVGFYKGCPPALARQLTNSGLALFLYKPLRERVFDLYQKYAQLSEVKQKGEVKSPLWCKMITASLSSACGQFLSTPFDVIKVCVFEIRFFFFFCFFFFFWFIFFFYFFFLTLV
jgi:hypothetical protein